MTQWCFSGRRGLFLVTVAGLLMAPGLAWSSVSFLRPTRALRVVRVRAGYEGELDNRRSFLARTVSAAAVVVLEGPAAPSFGQGATLETVEALGGKSKALRRLVRNTQGKAKKEVIRATEEVLIPLQAAMIEVAPTLGLEGEFQRQAETQPLLLKGHLIELQEAVDNAQFSEYVSKRTKDSYPGGKVERELEEVEETIDEFLRLAKLGKAKK